MNQVHWERSIDGLKSVNNFTPDPEYHFRLPSSPRMWSPTPQAIDPSFLSDQASQKGTLFNSKSASVASYPQQKMGVSLVFVNLDWSFTLLEAALPSWK